MALIYDENKTMLEQFKGEIDSTLDNIRKETLLKILRSLNEKYGPYMSFVPCKEHLIDIAIRLEEAIYKTVSSKEYFEPNTIEIVTNYLVRKNTITCSN